MLVRIMLARVVGKPLPKHPSVDPGDTVVKVRRALPASPDHHNRCDPGASRQPLPEAAGKPRSCCLHPRRQVPLVAVIRILDPLDTQNTVLDCDRSSWRLCVQKEHCSRRRNRDVVPVRTVAVGHIVDDGPALLHQPAKLLRSPFLCLGAATPAIYVVRRRDAKDERKRHRHAD